MATVSRSMHARNAVACAILLLALSHHSEAQGIFVSPPAEPVLTAARAAQMEAFANRWASELLARQGPDGERQRRQLWALFSRADAASIEEAAKQSTFAGAVAVLRGQGYKLSKASPASVVADMAAGSGGVLVDSPEALGSVGSDMVFTPITPCRVVDTRLSVSGAIPAGGTRSFVAVNSSSYTSQGGSATNCGTLGLAPGAVAVNVTAVFPTAGPGFATVYAFGTPRPSTASVNYSAGAIVNNALIVQIPDPLAASDFVIYTAAQSHYVVDIVGYFDTNEATALQCLETSLNAVNVLPNGTENVNALACPAGYTQTGTNCLTDSFLMPLVLSRNGTCGARNNDSVTRTLQASRTCCRVPGR